MTYKEVESYILEIPKFTKKNGLENTRVLIKKLGSPEKELKVVHVAGTNGKGSVCSFTSSMLIQAGHKTGLFTSPHLVEMTERFKVDGKDIEKDTFVEIFEEVKNAVEAIQKEGYAHPTFFEFLFAMALVYFRKEKVEYAIIETGLGGRLDSTNVIETPVLTAITSISLDHTEYLGETKEIIAGEKAGIIKENVPVVIGVNQDSVVKVLEKKAQEKNAEILKISKKDYEICEKIDKNIDFFVNVKYYGYVRLLLPCSGKYQVENAVLAIRIVEKLLDKNEFSPELLNQGLNKGLWPGRMERVMEDIYIDGAHNEDGIKAFLETAKALCTGKGCVLLFGAVREKNCQEMIAELVRELPCSKIIVTQLNTERTMNKEQLKQIFEAETKREVIAYETTKEAFQKALDLKKKEEIVFCVGSLYLVGELKAIIGESKNDKF